MYIPKNKIVTNQFSNNNKLVYKLTGEKYAGFYYKTYQSKYYTGKTPNDGPNDELILIEDTENGFIPNTLQSQIAYTDAPTIFDSIDTPNYSEELVVNYSQLKEINLDQTTYKSLPSQSFPSPTPDDYKLGVFTRYFCVKVNEDSYLELDKKTYEKLKSQDKNWVWELYSTFTLPWTISGEKADAEKVNYNVILLQEQRSKRRGLKEFLRGNYTKFWISQ